MISVSFDHLVAHNKHCCNSGTDSNYCPQLKVNTGTPLTPKLPRSDVIFGQQETPYSRNAQELTLPTLHKAISIFFLIYYKVWKQRKGFLQVGCKFTHIADHLECFIYKRSYLQQLVTDFC